MPAPITTTSVVWARDCVERGGGEEVEDVEAEADVETDLSLPPRILEVLLLIPSCIMSKIAPTKKLQI